MKIKALINDKVLAQIIVPVEQNSYGIFMSKAPTREAKVLMTGPNTKYIKIGDIIRHYGHCGAEILHDGIPCLILKEDSEIELIIDSDSVKVFGKKSIYYDED